MLSPSIELNVQSKYFLPDRGESLIFRLGLEPIIDNLNHRERIALSSKVSRVKPLSLHDFHNKMSNVLHLEKCVTKSLKEQ